MERNGQAESASAPWTGTLNEDYMINNKIRESGF